ncbi:MAG: hypothetical protein HYX20_00775 [Candidatus Yanofskybacteria bacterium]|nr:hypothetical protein [Candidatus Yanofskybacteria bacterium]
MNKRKLYGITKGQLIVLWVAGIVIWVWSFFKIFVTYFAIVSSISWPRLSPGAPLLNAALFLLIPLILILYTIGWQNHKKHLAVSRQQNNNGQAENASKPPPRLPPHSRFGWLQPTVMRPKKCRYYLHFLVSNPGAVSLPVLILLPSKSFFLVLSHCFGSSPIIKSPFNFPCFLIGSHHDS